MNVTTAPARTTRPESLGRGLRSPKYLFSRWPWLAAGYLALGLVLSWALSSVFLLLLVLSLVPAVRRALWPTLVRLEGWRLTLVDPEDSAKLMPSLTSMEERGDTPSLGQFAHLALVMLLYVPMTVLLSLIPFTAMLVLMPWYLFYPEAGAAIQVPEWLIFLWIGVASVIGVIVTLYTIGLGALLAGKIGYLLLRPTDAQMADLQANVDRLHASRSGLLDAATVERERIEGALHDGIQNQLVALSMKLGIAESTSDNPETVRLASDAHRDVDTVLADLRGIIRNIQPQSLREHGLKAAITDMAANLPLPVQVDVTDERMPRPVEDAAFYFASEALNNVVKHSGATLASVEAILTEPVDGHPVLVVNIRDNGHGGASELSGHGLRALRQRADAVDGTMTVISPEGGPTTVSLVCPAGDPGA